ncbi:MAG TPA: recombinase family protein, partial [Trebonia sp.]|nr:recombinase family protein [Trebonia sp.]
MRDRAILVARVSDTGQDEENQIPDMGAWSAGHDYVMAGPVVRIHGKSAFHGKHLEQLYREAVELVRADVADVIVMWAMDRGTRQGPDAAFRLRLDVKDAGGRLEFTEEPELNGDSLDAQEAWGKYSAEARRESEKRIRRVETGNHRAVANGAALRKPKYGWEITGPKRRKEWAVNAAKAAIAREMFTRAIDGETLGAIAIWASGADGGKWDASRVRKIIADPAYMGKARTTVSGEPYTYDCPPIVDAETWQRANAALKEPKRYVRVPVSPYAGVILCGKCGAVRRRTSGGGS